jgi:hypothetical protein
MYVGSLKSFIMIKLELGLPDITIIFTSTEDIGASEAHVFKIAIDCYYRATDKLDLEEWRKFMSMTPILPCSVTHQFLKFGTDE